MAIFLSNLITQNTDIDEEQAYILSNNEAITMIAYFILRSSFYIRT